MATDKRRLAVLIDVMIALAMLEMVYSHMYVPYVPVERNLRVFRDMHKMGLSRGRPGAVACGAVGGIRKATARCLRIGNIPV